MFRLFTSQPNWAMLAFCFLTAKPTREVKRRVLALFMLASEIEGLADDWHVTKVSGLFGWLDGD